MVWIESAAVGSKRPDFAPFGFVPEDDELERDDFRVRHLLSKMVRESVRDFHLREREGVFQTLTAEKIAAGVAQGKLGKAREEQQTVDVDRAIALAYLSGGLFMCLLTFGSAMKNDMAAVGQQLLYSVVFSALLFLVQYNQISVDWALQKRRTITSAGPN